MLSVHAFRCSNVTQAKDVASYHRDDELLKFSILPTPMPGHAYLSQKVLNTLSITPDKPLTFIERTNLLLGSAANGIVKLIPSERGRKVSAIDCVFSSDKSVSIVWANARPTQRALIELAHRRAVESGIEEICQTIGHVRRGGQANREYEKVSVIYSVHHHHTARPARSSIVDRSHLRDPQLHSHVTIFTLGLCQDGKCLTLDTLSLRGKTKFIGAVYQSELARELRKNGYPVEEVKSTARIQGISRALRTHFSSRAKAAEEHAHERARKRGLDFLSLSDRYQKSRMKQSVLATRLPKRLGAEVAEHFETWQSESTELGYISPRLSIIHETRDRQDLILDSATRAINGLSFEVERNGFVDRRTAETMAMRGLIAHSSLCRDDVEQIVECIQAAGVPVRVVAHKRSVKRFRRAKSEKLSAHLCRVQQARSDIAAACTVLRLGASSLKRERSRALTRLIILRRCHAALVKMTSQMGQVIDAIHNDSEDASKALHLRLPSPAPL